MINNRLLLRIQNEALIFLPLTRTSYFNSWQAVFSSRGGEAMRFLCRFVERVATVFIAALLVELLKRLLL